MMELNKNLIGSRIKLERNNLNLTQEELAIKLGLNNKSSVSQYESGDAIPSDDIKLLMTQIFNCSLDYLLGKSDIHNPEVITHKQYYMCPVYRSYQCRHTKLGRRMYRRTHSNRPYYV